MRALDDVVRAGKVLYIGISDAPAWVVSQANTIVRFDHKTQSFSTWTIPSGGGVVRHMVATPQGNLYLACSGVNKVGIT